MHTSDGALRRLVDEPAAVPAADAAHVADCARCSAGLTAARTDAALVASALDAPGAPGALELDVDLAWQRLEVEVQAAPAHRATARPGRVRQLVRRPAVAGLAVAVVLTGAGTAAANDWLQVFSTERVAPVSITTADLLALPDLSGYGSLELVEDPDVRSVADAAGAESATGLDVPEVAALPPGVRGAPAVTVGDRAAATFTFSSDRARRAAGEDLPPAPPGVEGTAVRLTAGPGVAQVWSSATGVPALVVGRAVAPTAFSSGAPFEVVRDHLLSLPGLPPALAEQLRGFAADGSTLPLPVPADLVTTSSAEVDGSPATLLETRDRALAAVVWVTDGVVTVVAGSLDTDEVLEVARELR